MRRNRHPEIMLASAVTTLCWRDADDADGIEELVERIARLESLRGWLDGYLDALTK
jgi:hypothetical protein